MTNLPMMLNAFHNEKFIFDNHLASRSGRRRQASSAARASSSRCGPGRHMWETNFVPRPAQLQAGRVEGARRGQRQHRFILADGTMHAHMSEMPVGTYKKAHRHGADFHIFR